MEVLIGRNEQFRFIIVTELTLIDWCLSSFTIFIKNISYCNKNIDVSV